MKLTQRGNRFYLVKRVPDRFSSVEPRKQIWVSLKTDSRSEAKARAHAAVRDLENQWLAKLNGECCDIRRYEALTSISTSRGFPYLPADEVARQTLDEILRRVSVAQENRTVAAAVLGAEKKPAYKLSSLVDLYVQLVAAEIKDKGRDQKRIWLNTLNRSFNRLIAVIGDKDISDLSRDDALTYRNHWVQRIEEEGIAAKTANRELTAIGGVFSKLYKLTGIGDPALFRNLAFASKRNYRPPYNESFIRESILPSLNAEILNDDASDILRILINTGMRPSEVTGLAAEDMYLDEEIPYLSIRPRAGRELKSQTSIRDIPLVGIAFDAAKRHPTGFTRYLEKTGTLSQTINKFLRANDLCPSPKHSVYSFRHGFQDRLTAAEAPDRIQADLMGHRYVRERYGMGPSLTQKAEWLGKVGFYADDTR